MTIPRRSSQVPSMAPLETADHGADDLQRRARFRPIFEREFDYVWGSLRRLGVPERDLEDVAQDLFVNVYRRLHEYEPPRPIRPWLFAFAVRCASNWRRLARNRLEVLGVDGEPLTHAPGADDALERAEEQAFVLRALQCIPIERRTVFILHEFDECRMPEIADALGIPLHTGYSRLRLAREEFATAVRRRWRGQHKEGGA
jgi:RNA polymerase sigma-70 factor (ECF subfamily)